MKLGLKLALRTFGYYRMKYIKYTSYVHFCTQNCARSMYLCIYSGEYVVVDKTMKPVSSKIWPDSTCAISVWRKGQILLVVGFLVLSTTLVKKNYPLGSEFYKFDIPQLVVFDFHRQR